MFYVSWKRFALAVLLRRQWKSIFTGGPQLPACKNDDFYWPLALAVTKNATINMFTTATIELLCTSAISYMWRLELTLFIFTEIFRGQQKRKFSEWLDFVFLPEGWI
jgi:hypothetical protein